MLQTLGVGRKCVNNEIMPWNEGTEWNGLQTVRLRKAELTLLRTLRFTQKNQVDFQPTWSSHCIYSSSYSLRYNEQSIYSSELQQASSYPLLQSSAGFRVTISPYYRFSSLFFLFAPSFPFIPAVIPSRPRIYHLYQCFPVRLLS